MWHWLDLYVTLTWPLCDIDLTFMWHWLDLYVTLTWPLCDIDLTFMWHWLDLYVTLTWPLCDIDLTFMWHWLDLYVTLTWPLCDIDLTFMWHWLDMTLTSPVSWRSELIYTGICYSLSYVILMYSYYFAYVTYRPPYLHILNCLLSYIPSLHVLWPWPSLGTSECHMNRDSGLSKYGILGMQWTTGVPVYGNVCQRYLAHRSHEQHRTHIDAHHAQAKLQTLRFELDSDM